MEPFRKLLWLLLLGSAHGRRLAKSSYSASPIEQANWELTGDAEARPNGALLTSTENQKGAIWNMVPLAAHSWEIIVQFRVSSDASSGGEGFALWVVREKNITNLTAHGSEGPVFGYRDDFTGLGVFFDTHDDDGNQDNPSVSAMVGDGHSKYDSSGDGWTSQLGGCLTDYRNQEVSARVHLNRVNGTTAEIVVSLDATGAGFVECFSFEHEFPKVPDLHIGVTASTSAKPVFDEHLIASITTYSLATPRDEQSARHLTVVPLTIDQDMLLDSGSNATKKPAAIDQTPEATSELIETPPAAVVSDQSPKIMDKSSPVAAESSTAAESPAAAELSPTKPAPQVMEQLAALNVSLDTILEDSGTTRRGVYSVLAKLTALTSAVSARLLPNAETPRLNASHLVPLAAISTANAESLKSIQAGVDLLRKEQSALLAAAAQPDRTRQSNVLEQLTAQSLQIKSTHQLSNALQAQLAEAQASTSRLLASTAAMSTSLKTLEQHAKAQSTNVHLVIQEVRNAVRFNSDAIKRLEAPQPASPELQAIAARLERVEALLVTASQASSSPGLWWFVLLFQFIFGACFVYWKQRQRAEREFKIL